jgi:hypothetical protein
MSLIDNRAKSLKQNFIEYFEKSTIQFTDDSDVNFENPLLELDAASNMKVTKDGEIGFAEGWSINNPRPGKGMIYRFVQSDGTELTRGHIPLI